MQPSGPSLGTLARESAWTVGDRTVERVWPGTLGRDGSHAALEAVLSEWARSDPKPSVLFVDEIDSLVGDTLISVLRQLRSGYRDRPGRFPLSVALCRVRDVRDYRIQSASGEIVQGGSAFNVKAESLRLGDFHEDEVRDLLEQHTGETGQAVTEEALAGIWAQTRGQPWLVNALAYEACFRNRAARDRARPITPWRATRTYSSWLIQVARWFGLISQQTIRRGTFTSVTDLIRRVHEFTKARCTATNPFVWVATAQPILVRIGRLSTRVAGSVCGEASLDSLTRRQLDDRVKLRKSPARSCRRSVAGSRDGVAGAMGRLQARRHCTTISGTATTCSWPWSWWCTTSAATTGPGCGRTCRWCSERGAGEITARSRFGRKARPRTLCWRWQGTFATGAAFGVIRIERRLRC